MHNLQTPGDLLPHVFLFEVHARHPALVHIRLIFAPVQRKRDADEFTQNTDSLSGVNGFLGVMPAEMSGGMRLHAPNL